MMITNLGPADADGVVAEAKLGRDPPAVRGGVRDGLLGDTTTISPSETRMLQRKRKSCLPDLQRFENARYTTFMLPCPVTWITLP